jgi:hypothetical protein
MPSQHKKNQNTQSLVYFFSPQSLEEELLLMESDKMSMTKDCSRENKVYINYVYFQLDISGPRRSVFKEIDPTKKRPWKKRKDEKKTIIRPLPRTASSKIWVSWKCDQCGTHQTPERRTGPRGRQSLCNACGLRFAKLKNSTAGQDRRNAEKYSIQERMSVYTLLA